MAITNINGSINMDTMSIQEREVFITRSALALIDELFNVSDDKGLKVLIKNFSSLLDFAQDRRDLLQRKTSIADSLKDMLHHINTSGIDEAFAEGIDNIAALTTDFMSITGADGSDDFSDDQAVSNIKALMQKELETWEASRTA